jgi:TorA maturation chaperone TorD
VQKDEGVSLPEDSLVVMLDTFASLVEEEKSGGGEKIRRLQGRLLEEFLEPFTEKFTATLKNNEHADFYYLCCRILGGYLDLEKSLTIVV